MANISISTNSTTVTSTAVACLSCAAIILSWAAYREGRRCGRLDAKRDDEHASCLSPIVDCDCDADEGSDVIITPKASGRSNISIFPEEESPPQSRQTISELTIQIRALETKVKSLTEENSKLAAKLEKYREKQSGAKERRLKLKSKLARMSGTLKEDFGDEIDISF